MKNQSPKIEDTFASYEEIEENMFLETGTMIFNKYEIIGLLGYGGMGQVYLAKDLQLGRSVAVKTLSVENVYNVEHRARFMREAQMAATVNHPNVLTIYEAGFEGNRPFLVMEYVEGKTLREMVNLGQMDMSLALNLSIQLAQGLLSLHKMGIIHRDLKLDNFILRNDGYLKILDFGLAKNTEEKESRNKFETCVGMVLGTPRYMSPEQAKGQKLDIRSDIFSFGSVVYELLTGQLAFDDEDDIQALYQVVFYPAAPMPNKVPAKLRQIVEKTMEKKVAARPESMQEVLNVLLEVRDQQLLFTEKKEISHLFATSFITPVSNEIGYKKEKVNCAKKLTNVTATQIQALVNDNVDSEIEFNKPNLKKAPVLYFPLIQVPISHVAGVSSPVNPSNIFFDRSFKNPNRKIDVTEVSKEYLSETLNSKIDCRLQLNKIIKFPTLTFNVITS